LWAVAEFGHSLGIRSLLYGDLDPVNPPEFRLSGYNTIIEPAVRYRAWRTMDRFAIGPESWGLTEHKQYLRQLAKQKYNRIIISAHTWQPFVHFEFQGVRKQTGMLWYGWKYRVDGDTAGRAAFAGAKFFDNPDFANAVTYEDRLAAGQKLIRGIISSAHELGMTVGLSLSPLEFPHEFAAVLPGAQVISGLEELAVGPGPAHRPDDPLLAELTKAQLRAWFSTYPDLDAVYLSLSDIPEWSTNAEASWKILSDRVGNGSFPTLPQLTEAAQNRSSSASHDREVKTLRGHLISLDFLIRLRADDSLFRRPDGQSLEVNFSQIDPLLLGNLDSLLPPHTEALHSIDSTARRVAENLGVLKITSTSAAHSSLIVPLADDQIGVLPQAAHKSVGLLLNALKENHWQGFSTRSWCIGDLDFSSYFLSRSACETNVTPDQALQDMLVPVCGDGIADRVAKAMELAEAATTLVDQNDPGFSFPVPNMIIRHYLSDEAPPEWWGTVKDHYLNAMNEMYRANTRAREGGRSYTLYHARRFEFGYEYMNCIEAVRKAGIAKRTGNPDEHSAQLDTAVNSLNAALNAMAAVARSNSDRGIIAVLNEYGYRPLMQELEAIDQQ
jgi:hypothetical protein